MHLSQRFPPRGRAVRRHQDPAGLWRWLVKNYHHHHHPIRVRTYECRPNTMMMSGLRKQVCYENLRPSPSNSITVLQRSRPHYLPCVKLTLHIQTPQLSISYNSDIPPIHTCIHTYVKFPKYSQCIVIHIDIVTDSCLSSAYLSSPSFQPILTRIATDPVLLDEFPNPTASRRLSHCRFDPCQEGFFVCWEICFRFFTEPFLMISHRLQKKCL